MSFRRWYYNRFSSFYDWFVRVHSRDHGESLRAFLAETASLHADFTVVDLCTGTGSSALRMARDSGARVIGVDFAEGMLHQARRKSLEGRRCSPVWVKADVRALPIASGSVDRVTCAYAMYELSGGAREQTLKEVVRVLRPGGMFLMMEHLPPTRPLIKLLYLIRIYLLGTRGVRSFAGSEERELARHLENVGRRVAPGGRTKATYGYKAARDLG
jgi:demethylmenaquinone methyltransferase/2-methoxy-6-polyprenyl-1,4-benzoquinol methylase